MAQTDQSGRAIERRPAYMRTFAFARFRLNGTEHQLLHDGTPIALTPKAFDLLVVLVENSGHVLTKDELMHRVWPDGFVEEINLAYNISTLRKALSAGQPGERYIETIPKVGYRFVVPVTRLDDTINSQMDFIPPSSQRLKRHSEPLKLTRKELTRRTHHRVPAPLTPLIGRQGELAAIQRWLVDDNKYVRLKTLFGSPGVGKTRLGIEAARMAQDGFEDVFYIELAPITSSDLVAGVIARSLNVKEDAHQNLIDSICHFLHDRHALLVLDNLEHVINAAPLIVEILANAPRVKAIVTSRELLHVRGEQAMRVDSLTVPNVKDRLSVDGFQHFSAIALFVGCTQAVRPDFALTEDNVMDVVQLCARLDGLPLAIELAASRMDLLDPKAMLQRLGNDHSDPVGLRDLPVRQRTLSDAIDWSYNLLSPLEQRLFRGLGAFVGGSTLLAVNAILNQGSDTWDSLASLADKSLIQVSDALHGEPRFSMLVTIHDYALLQLTQCGELEQVRQIHADYFLELVNMAEPKLYTLETDTWLDHLDREHPNLRAALDWYRTRCDARRMLTMTSRLAGFWELRNYLSEGRQWLADALKLVDMLQHNNDSQRLHAHALHGAGSLASGQGDHTTSDQLLDQALRLYTELNDESGMAAVLSDVASSKLEQGDTEGSRAVAATSVDLARAVDDDSTLAYALMVHAQADSTLGNQETALLSAKQSLDLFRQQGDRYGQSHCLFALGMVAISGSEFEQAEAYLTEAISLSRSLDSQGRLAISLCLLGLNYLYWGRRQQATESCDEALDIFQQIGKRAMIAWCLTCRGRIALHSDDWQLAEASLQHSLRLRHETGFYRGIALTWLGMAQLALAVGQPHLTAIWLGVTNTAVQTTGHQFDRFEQMEYETVSVRARGCLDEQDYAAASAEGAALTLEEAIELASIEQFVDTRDDMSPSR